MDVSRVEVAVNHLRRFEESGGVDDLDAALAIVRDLSREVHETPEERARREFRKLAEALRIAKSKAAR